MEVTLGVTKFAQCRMGVVARVLRADSEALGGRRELSGGVDVLAFKFDVWTGL